MFLSVSIRIASYIAVAAIFCAIVFFIYDKGRFDANSKWQSKWDAQVERLEKESAIAKAAELEKEAAWLKQLNEVRDNAKKSIDRISTDLANSDDSANRLRNQVARLASRADRECANSRSTEGGSAARSAADMLAELSTGLDNAAGEIAEFADKSRSAGVACQQSYGVIKNPR